MDITAIQGTITSINTAFDMLKRLRELKSSYDFREELATLHKALIDAQESAVRANHGQSAAIDRIRNLEEEISKLKEWGAEKQNYELKCIASGAFVYSAKESVEPVQPAHNLCATCYNNGKKSILQTEILQTGRDRTLVCHTCNSVIYETGMRRPDHPKR